MPKLCQQSSGAATDAGGVYALLPLEDLHALPMNPRRTFLEEDLAELAESIRAQGVLQPVLVRLQPVQRHGRQGYEIIAGERRCRAAKMAGLTHIPAVVRAGVEHKRAIALALIENIQRQDLNAIEEAQAINNLTHLGYKQAEIGPLLGLSQSALANRVRLLSLPAWVQERIIGGGMGVGLALGLMARVNEAREAGVEVDAGALAEAVIRRGVSAKEIQREIPAAVRADLQLPTQSLPATRRTSASRAGDREHPASVSSSRQVCPYCGGSGFMDAA